MGTRKRNIVIKKGLDEWVMTYGDMMSLLLTFFILIVSFSSMQESKFQEAAVSLQGAFGVFGDPASVIEFTTPLVPDKSTTGADADLEFEVNAIEKAVLDVGAEKALEIEVLDDGVLFRIDAPSLFRSGGAELADNLRGVLDEITPLLMKYPNQVRVEGHTDNVPITSEEFGSNWELSAARAVTVARYFQSLGLSPERMAATGYGEYRPLADNTTAEGRAQNRRVEVFLTLDRKGLKREGKLPMVQGATEASSRAAEPTLKLPEKPAVRPIINPVTGRLGSLPGGDR